MNPAQKALWFIESHLARELTFDEVAAMAGISRFHMVRAFCGSDAPSFERYDENFDPLTGNGGLDIWVPARE